MKTLAILFVLMGFLVQVSARAESKPKKSKSIDFDSSVVEGINRRPYDSLSNVSDASRNKDRHLYQKRKSFSPENRDSLRERRFAQ